MRDPNYKCIYCGNCPAARGERSVAPSNLGRAVRRDRTRPLLVKDNAIRGSTQVWLVLVVAVAVVGLLLVGWLRGGRAKATGRGLVGEFRSSAKTSRGPDPTSVFSEPLAVRLAQAVVNGDIPGIQGALKAGAKLNGQGRDGLTPLHLALLHFQLESFSALLAGGADPNSPAKNGDSVMSLVSVMPDPAWLEAAVAHGGDVERRDGRDRTPLMLAARRERPANIKLLVMHGADVNARDKRSDTPLFHTFQALHPSAEIARILLDRGAKADQPNAAGFTARDYAATHGDRSLLAIFSDTR